MLFDYLNNNFLSEPRLLAQTGGNSQRLHDLIEAQVVPAPSYRLDMSCKSHSFFGEHQERQDLRFYSKGQVDWIKAIKSMGIEGEPQAKAYFLVRFEAAQQAFFAGTLGQALDELMPDLRNSISPAQFEETWGYFLDGTYGVCTRDNLPETIFLKQTGVRFIKYLTAITPEEMADRTKEVLRQTVDLLDSVEADFAPHEVSRSSRQRCILDVRQRYFEAGLPT
ncbi:DUF6058 family natural product biosynthesis protein [Flexibacterium corallicola]|uniref:DUF6058 family natural product biosynthesis protein n=1 Tax=Flexibacterium corallicola TaxID=3037259 RepID=UPI00286F2209|nr:DUF6058 family natural product biosynthesis protein [Pseudovibrio sp. M1P-2-3]